MVYEEPVPGRRGLHCEAGDSPLLELEAHMSSGILKEKMNHVYTNVVVFFSVNAGDSPHLFLYLQIFRVLQSDPAYPQCFYHCELCRIRPIGTLSLDIAGHTTVQLHGKQLVGSSPALHILLAHEVVTILQYLATMRQETSF